MDPDSIGKDQRFSSGFAVDIHFKSLCPKAGSSQGACRPEKPLTELCTKCRHDMEEEIRTCWLEIKGILDVR